jgi:hypothetical protein
MCPGEETGRDGKDLHATGARFHFDALVRVVVHLKDRHFVVLEYDDGRTRVHESDVFGVIWGDWFGCAEGKTFLTALVAFATEHKLPIQKVLAEADRVRTKQLADR